MLLTLKLYVTILKSWGFKHETLEVIRMDIANRRHAPYTKFKALLIERGVKQGDLAAALGKSASALNQNLNGTGGDFSLPEIRVICSLLDITADEYFIRPYVSKVKQDNTA